jgi:hypothetical protein
VNPSALHVVSNFSTVPRKVHPGGSLYPCQKAFPLAHAYKLVRVQDSEWQNSFRSTDRLNHRETKRCDQ